MTLLDFVFYLLALLIVAGAGIVVTTRNVFRSALALTASLTLLAGIFVCLRADFVAAAQILVYVGGVMILMLFAVMFSQKPLEMYPKQTGDHILLGGVAAGLVGLALFSVVLRVPFNAIDVPLSPSSHEIGRLLMNEMILPFEVISLVILTALIGAVYFGQSLAKRRKR